MGRLRIVINSGAVSNTKSVAVAAASLTVMAVRRGILRNIPGVQVNMGMLGTSITLTKQKPGSHLSHKIRLQLQPNGDWEVLEVSKHFHGQFGTITKGIISDAVGEAVVNLIFKE